MPELPDIYAFLSRTCGVRESDLSPGADLERDAGITGDDFFELADAFSNEFGVDMASYRWYFHHAEEAMFNPGALIFRPPNRQVQHIAVTPKLLLQAAESGTWPASYPEHRLPRHRYDILFTYVFIAVCGLALGVGLLHGRGGA